ncbi:MAG: methyltransferase [Terriglobia bacterium]|nr:MAG: methyltransferase [Terriglobia bacterium]
MSAGGGQAVTPERILQMMWGYAPPLILAAAVEHRIFDSLESGPKSAEEIAAATGTSLRGVRPILNALAGLQFLSKPGRDRYALAPESAVFLLRGKPGYLGEMLQHQQALISDWLDLPEVVKTGRPAGDGTTGESGAAFFEELVSALFPMNFPAAQALGKALNVGIAPFRVLDVAAGSGVWGIGVAQQSPAVTVTAVDWPNVLEVTRRFAQQFGLAGRFSYTPGNMNEVAFGQSFDLVILGHILHSGGERDNRKLLEKSFQALVPGGRIAIPEFLVNEEGTGPMMPLFFAINMLVHTDAGDAYSFEQIAKWLRETGFADSSRIEPGGPSSIVVATKPAAR